MIIAYICTDSINHTISLHRRICHSYQYEIINKPYSPFKNNKCMKQMKSLLLLLSLCICMNINATVYSGNCGANGDNVKWTLDTETGLLEI